MVFADSEARKPGFSVGKQLGVGHATAYRERAPYRTAAPDSASKPCAGSSGRREQVTAPKSTVQKGRCYLPLKVSDEPDENLAAGLKHNRNCGRLKANRRFTAARKEPTGRAQLLPQGRALPATFSYLFLHILIFSYYLFI